MGAGLYRRPLDCLEPAMTKRASTLKRPIHSMPDDVREALRRRELMDEYRARPPYQRNDYLGWIARAKRAETRARRLAQMLDELERGDRYMKMKYRPRIL